MTFCRNMTRFLKKNMTQILMTEIKIQTDMEMTDTLIDSRRWPLLTEASVAEMSFEGFLQS